MIEDEQQLDDVEFPCAYCQKLVSDPLCCEFCTDTFYCSKEHAELHWNVHKERCGGMQKKIESPTGFTGIASAASATIKNAPVPQFSPTSRGTQRSVPKSTRMSAVDNTGRGSLFKSAYPESRRFTQLAKESLSPQVLKLKPHPMMTEEGDEDDNFQSDENQPYDPNVPRVSAKRRILYHLWKNDFERAKKYAEGQYLQIRMELDQADNDENYVLENIDEIMQSFLMYVKCLLLTDGANNEAVREILGILSHNILESVKIDYQAVKDSISEEKNSDRRLTERAAYISNFADFKRILQMHAIIAAMYKQLENQVETEKMYANYCRMIEKLYGIQSIEASNCYFYLGIYYYEEQKYETSLICMTKALFNRINELGESHVSVSDCHLNIGLIYKRLNQYPKAKTELEKALTIRRERIGKSSLPCGVVLEELGKLSLEIIDYKNALSYLQECYEIRKKLLKNPKHMDLSRVSLLLIYLNRKINKELQKDTEKDKIQYEKNVQLHAALSQLSKSSKKIDTNLRSHPNVKITPDDPPEFAPPRAVEEKKEILELENASLSEPPEESFSISEFLPQGFNKLVEFHTEDNTGEGVIDTIIDELF